VKTGIQSLRKMSYFVYILASKKNGTLYVGFTDDLSRRLYEHKNKMFDGFTKKYRVDKLVYFERQLTSEDAIKRESQLKIWNRKWKIELIEKHNPDWKDFGLDLPKRLNFEETMDSLFQGSTD
jgi:putative endonuclease